MIKSRLNQLKSKFKFFNIDGYIIPKNDEFFSEYSSKDRLKFISNFDGSAGVAVVLKNKNYLFVDGRYTIQAEKQCGKLFKIINYDKILNCNLFKNLTLGIDPKIFTSNQIKKTFIKYNKIKEIELNLVDFFLKQNNFNIKPFFSLEKNVTGLDHYSKIKKVSNILKKYKSKYLFISAPENISWLLNIRGYDNPNSPITNARLLIDNKEKIFLISQKDKLKKINLNNLVEKVRWHAELNEKPGYDITSYDDKGEEIYIEVKSSSGKTINDVDLTKNEILAMLNKKTKEKYYIYLVTNALTKPEIEVIKNPSERLKDIANFNKILSLFEKMQGDFNIDLVTLNLDFRK